MSTTETNVRPAGSPSHVHSLIDLHVALVHDYLNQRGGAERVVLELSDLWPEAPIYTSLYRPGSTHPGFGNRTIRTSPLDRLPVDRGFRNLFPLYPAAFRSFGDIQADVVIASSSGWGHMARTHPDALHLVYCHTPARWLYGGEHLGSGRASWRGRAVRGAATGLRRVDRRAALRADIYIANSENVRSRIRAVYGIDAHVLYPPVDTGRFTPRPRGERLLVVSRLLPYKHVDLAVRVASRMGIGLDVVGDGPLMPALRELAGATVTMHGALSDDAIVQLMESCRAVCVLAEEDFGIVAVEAQAAGKPVIALGRGGSLESIEPSVTGTFFLDHDDESFASAITATDSIGSTPAEIAKRAERFSRERFQADFLDLLGRSVSRARDRVS